MGLFYKRVKREDIIYLGQLAVIVDGNLYHSHNHELHKIKDDISLILKQNKQIMGKIDDLNALVKELQASVDAKQDSLATAIAAFEKTIADLQAIIAGNAGSGATDEQLQSVIDSIAAAKSDIESTPTA